MRTTNIDYENNDSISVTGTIIHQIVKEQDEYAMNMIEEFVKNKRAKGEFVAASIIPEGQLRHILNLGIQVYNHNIKPTELFPQEEYIEFLRAENKKLREQIERRI